MSHRERTSSNSHKTREVKYERVEKMHIDGSGHVNHRDVRVDQGGEDPYLNFKDKRPDDITPGEPAGVIPHLLTPEEIEAAKLSRQSSAIEDTTSRHTSISTRAVDSDVSSIHSGVGRVETTETITIRARELEAAAGTTKVVSAVDLGPSEYYNHIVRTHPIPPHPAGRRPGSTDLGAAVSETHTRTLGHHERTVEPPVEVARTEVITNTGAPVTPLHTLQDIERSSTTTLGPQLGRVDSGIDYRHTEVVTSTSAGPHIGGLQRTVVVPTGTHSEIHETTEVFRHGGATQSETHVIQVPVTTIGHTNMESVRTGYTVTEDKLLTVAAPSLAAPIHNQLDFNLGGGAHAEIHAATTMDLSAVQRQDHGPEEYARYKAKVEALARRDERETGLRAAEYRDEVERDAELIRQTLERQHIRDLEFRREMIEKQVDRQEKEIQLEAEYAMRALELERQAAREALETAKAQTHVDVRVDTAVGTTISRGDVDTHAERHTRERIEPVVETTTTVLKQYSSTQI